MSIIGKNRILQDYLDEHHNALAARENVDSALLRQGLDKGTVTLLANPAHPDVLPTLIGRPATVKVNANLGTSPFCCDPAVEMDKLRAAEQAGAHAVMDLSTAGDLDEIRTGMIRASRLPLGTVPLYSLAQRCVAEGRDPAGFEPSELLDEIRKQAEQGVDFMTVHCGLTRRGAQLATSGNRLMGIVSRGGSILARWMRDHDAENPLLTHYDEVLDLALAHNVTLSLGDGLRPGAGADAGDAAQWEEVLVLGELTLRARERGVQVMIEGPGHVPLDLVEAQIRSIKQATHDAPLYVLGPLVTDCAPGYDHIAGAIGGALAARSGADFLCYLTPAEHLTLPTREDVWNGVMASLVAAHAAEVSLRRPEAVARDHEISRARKELDWDAVRAAALDPELVERRRGEHKKEKECAMCGKFCAVRMLDE
ncbi:MAG: phosphomethylpyrimidine synthase ThiC [Desulfovibrionaceae bacterium]|jgi:phosphomethylpyrimidine synthase|nr:phosphomethylpyrimidine synthase ThiC [Desulfovibrionaceae bacterium]